MKPHDLVKECEAANLMLESCLKCGESTRNEDVDEKGEVARQINSGDSREVKKP